MEGDIDRARARLTELVRQLVAAPHGTSDTRLFAEEVRGLGAYVELVSSEKTLEEIRRTARATRLLAYATVVLAIATVGLAILAAIR